MSEEKFSEDDLDDLLNSFDMSDIDNINFDQMNEYFGFDIMGIEQEAENLENEKLEFKFRKSTSDAVTPSYAYQSDSGFDLFSSEEKWIFPLDRALIPTGIHFDIPMNYELQIRSKSGLALNQGLMVLNSPGTVDCFSEDMKILTIDGDKTIKELRIGDIVYSFNEDSLEVEKDVVSSIFDTGIQEVLLIDTEHGILEVTFNSEVYTKDGIKLAKNLTENDEIIIF